MKRELHVRICGSREGQFLPATRQVIDAEREREALAYKETPW